MQQAVKTVGGEHRLTLGEILDGLIEEKLISAEAAEQLKKERRYYRGTMHPLAIVADQKWKKGNALLTLDALTEWLAKRVGLEYLHIDPLKIDFAAVTEVMSSAYATRFRILPVGVSAKEAIVATAEPHVREWEAELARISKREIRRVIANPLDIERYQVEFYNLARSIKGANRTASAASGLSNFEQLVELGKSDKQFDANDAHIVRIVDWLWQYAFEQRASDIHIEPRREQGIVRFRIDGVLHQVYQIPAAVLAAMTSRIKILGRMDVVEKRRPQDGRIKTRTLEQADGLRREDRDAHLRSRGAGARLPRARLLGRRPEALERDDCQAERHRAGNRADRLGQDHHPVLDAEDARHARSQRLHHRGPDRDGRARVQPDAGTAGDRARLRRGRARADAPGPRHHHGRRDPRPRDRRDGGAVGAHRPPGALDAAHQRRAQRRGAAARARRRALPAERDPERRHGAAPGAHAVPALQAEGGLAARRGRGSLGCAGRAVESEPPSEDLQARRLPRVPHDRLSGAGRNL